MMGLIYVAEVAAGWLTFESFAWQNDSVPTVMTGVLTFLVVFIFVGWNEELLSRGYHLQTLASGQTYSGAWSSHPAYLGLRILATRMPPGSARREFSLQDYFWLTVISARVNSGCPLDCTSAGISLKV